jgi:hypothetical protein
MHTGQNSIAPENSLPQLGQMRRGSVLIVVTALQPQFEPKPTARSTECCKIGLRGPWQSCCPVPQAIACLLFTVARQIKFRNKIPTFGDPPAPVTEVHL